MGIEKLEGRELDAVIAEKIFDRPSSYYDCPHFDKNRRMLSFCSCPDLPRYSRDIAAAMQVAEKMRERGIYITIVPQVDGYLVTALDFQPIGHYYFYLLSLNADNFKELPEAICKAAVLAAEAE